jgi:serine/threonine protein kinase
MINISENKYNMIENGKERMLIVNNVDTEDEGEYVCQSGKYRVALYLTINEDSTTSEIRSDDDHYELYFQDDRSLRSSRRSSTTTVTKNIKRTYTTTKEMYVNEGMKHAELKCKVKDPRAQVSWYKDDQHLGDSNNEKYEFISNGNERILIVKNPVRSDNGDYICQSGNNKIILNLKVNAYSREITPVIMNQAENDLYVRNEECYKPLRRASSNTTLQRTQSNEVLQRTSSNEVLQRASSNETLQRTLSSEQLMFKPEIQIRKSQLTLQDFQNLVPTTDIFKTEKIIYQNIEDTNKSVSSLFPIKETSPLQNSTFISVTSVAPNKLKSVKLENDLEFTKQLEPYTDCDEGHDCILECWVNKFATSAQWFIDNNFNEALNEKNKKYEITNQDGRKHRLLIKNALPDDKAIYTCRVNDLIQSNTLLNINENMSLKITQGLTDLHVPEYENNVQFIVELNKRVRNDGKSCQIKWFLDKKEININDKNYQMFTMDNQAILKILREITFDQDNNSHVECRIQEIKHSVHTIELQTKCRIIVDRIKEFSGQFTKKLDDFIQADSGLHLDLEVRVNFDPVVVNWFKNNSEILNTNLAYQVINDPLNRSYILRIKNCRLKDSGIYTCHVDSLQCSGEVKIIETPIKFTQQLQDQFYDLEVDSSLTLDCQLNKPPSLFGIKPRWFKNDLEIIGSQNSKYDLIEEHNICALIIYDLDERDEGRYRCQIGNERTECRIKPEYVLVKYLPNYMEPRESETCTLSFSVNRPPNGLYSTPVTKWYKDGQELTDDSNKYWFIEHGENRSLTIQNCNPSDSGLYKAFITDETVDPPLSLVSTNSCQVSVKKLKIDFLKPLQSSVVAKLDETVKLYCETLQENLKPKWYCNEVLIEASNTIKSNKETYSTQTQHFLIINQVKEQDSGQYKIKFGTDLEYISELTIDKQAQYSLKPLVEKPVKQKTNFISHLKDVRCNEGDDFEIECNLNRNLRDVDLIEWKKNNEFFVNSVGSNYNRFSENLLSDSEFEFINSDNKCILRFKNCKRSDAGQYELNIVELDDIPEPGKEPVVIKSKCNVFITNYVEKSEILKQLPRTVRLIEGDTIKLECQLDKKPERAQWYRNSIELVPVIPEELHGTSIDIYSLDDGKLQILEITNAQTTDDGTYQLNADDKLSICEIKIKPIGAKFDKRPPEFIHFDKKKELDEGNDTLSIECTVDKNNARVKWFKGNDEIIIGELFDKDKFEIVHEGSIHCLLIHDLDANDAGDYYCSLGSEFSKTQVTIDDNLDETKTPKIFEPKYEKIDVYEGKGLVMGIDLDTNEPSHKCVWYKDANPINLQTSHIKNEIVENKKHTLKIDKLSMIDSGRYELIMNDLIDNSSLVLAIIDLNVKEKPIAIVKKLTAQKVQNSILLLECEVSKSIITGQYIHTWKKDGLEISLDDQHIARNIVNEKICRLYINKFDYVDSGIYEFSVYDINFPELKETTSFRLDIKQNPFKSGMRVANTDMNKTRLLIIEFETVNDKYEITDMKWKKNNTLINFELNQKYLFRKIESNKFSLEIRNIDASDNGSYVCSIDEFSNKLNLTGIENIIQQATVNYEIQETLHEQNDEETQNVQESVAKQQIFVLEETNKLPKDAVEIKRTESLVNLIEDVDQQQQEIVQEVNDKIKIEKPYIVEEPLGNDLTDGVNIKRAESLVNLIEQGKHYNFEELSDELDTVQEEKSYIVEEPQELLDDSKNSLLIKRAQSLANLVENKEEITDSVSEIKDDSHIKVENLTVKEFELKDDLADIKSLKIKRAQSLASLIENKEDLGDFVDELKTDLNQEKISAKDVDYKDELAENKNVKIKRAQSQANLIENKDEENHQETHELKLKNKPVEEKIKEKTYDDDSEKQTQNLIKIQDKPQSMVKETEQKEIVEEVTEFIEENETTLVKSKSSPVPEDKLQDKDTKTIKKPLSRVNTVEEVNQEEKLSDLKTEKIDEIKPEARLQMIDELEKPKLIGRKLSQVTQISENVKEETCDQIINKTEDKHELKADSSEAKENKDELSKPSEIRHSEKSLEIMKSNWKPSVKILEKENLDLSLTINRPSQNIESIELYKNDAKLDTAKENIVIACRTENKDNSEISLNLKDAKIDQTGQYKLCIKEKTESKERELASTNLLVSPKPINVIGTLKSDKTDYIENDNAIFKFKLSKPLPDKEKCIEWKLDDEIIEILETTHYEMTEEITEQEEVIYTLKVKTLKPKTDEGVYKLRVFATPNNEKSEIYKSEIKINIQEEPVKIFESNWEPKLDLNEEEKVELNVCINKKLQNCDKLVLTKNGIRIKPNDSIQITLNNEKLLPDRNESCCEVKLSIPVVLAKDTGLYKLSLKSENRKSPDTELGQTNLTVKEVPLEIISHIKADKSEYFENEEIILSVKLSKPVEDLDKCMIWTLNGKVLDTKSTRTELLQSKTEDGIVYSLKVKNAQIGINDGQYSVKFRSKIFDTKDFTEACKISIKERQIEYEILESNWTPETEILDNKQLELFLRLKVNQPLTESNILVYKDLFPFLPNDKISFDIQNIEKDNQCLMKLKFNDTVKEESGLYKLCLKNKNRDLLVSTNIYVGKRLKVIEEFKSDKVSYLEEEDIKLTIKLNEPVENKRKCLNWFYNDQIMFIEDYSYELVEEKTEEFTKYSLNIKSAKLGVHDGTYRLSILAKPDDKNSQIYKNEVKIVINEIQLEVFDSNWLEELHLNENDNAELKFSLNKAINKDEIVFYKDGKEIRNDIDIYHMEVEKNETNKTSKITLILNETKPKHSGKYKVTLKGRKNFRPIETDLVNSKITILETPCNVLEPLKSDKTEYNVGQTINISFKLSKPVQDKDKCIIWSLNNRTVDLKSKQIKITEQESEGISYKLSVESCDVGKNDGEYSVKVKSKTMDKTDLYTGSVIISVIDPDKFDVLESNWQPEIKLKEDDNHELFIKISKPINDIKELILTKNKSKFEDEKQVKLSYENIKVDSKKDNCLIKVKFNEAKINDSGVYKLSIIDKKNKNNEIDLGLTILTVSETPFLIIEPIKTNKPSYFTEDDIIISVKLSKPLLDKQKCFIITQNGKELNLKDFLFSEEIHQNLETTYTLNMNSCKPEENNGDYTVRLLSKPNDKGTEFYSGSLRINVTHKPVEILSKLKVKEDNEIYENEAFTLICKLSTPNLPIKWLRNDKPIDGILSKKKYLPISEFDGTYALTVYTTINEDSGVYSISLPKESVLAEKSDLNDLKANILIKQPAITIFKDISVTPSDKLFTKETVSFIVTLSRSTYNYEWFKDGNAIKTDTCNRYSLTTEKDKNEKFTVKLTIKDLEIEDSAEYKLITEQVESKIVNLLVQNLKIELKLVSPLAKSGGSIFQIDEDDAEILKFECISQKDFEGKVQWFKNDKAISLVDAALYKTEKVVENSTFIYKLFAYKPKPSRLVKTVDYNYHNGIYYAQFNSSSRSNSLEIKVNKAPQNEFAEHLNFKVINSKSSDLITEHSTVSLKCATKFQIKNNVTVRWFKNKVELQEASYKISSQNNQEFELLIPDCNADKDSGTFKIEIGENDTKISEEIKIEIIKDKLNLEALVIQGDDIHESGQVILVAKVSRKPKKVEWLKDGKPLSPKDKRFLPTIGEEEIKLKIDNLQLSDNSIYTLKVDDSESSYKLVVNELSVKFIKELSYEIVSSEDKSNCQYCLKLSSTTNKSLNLIDNKYTIKWFKDGNLIKTETSKSSKINKYDQSSEDEKKTHILFVNNLEKNDCGKYEIRIYENQSDTILAQSVTTLKLSELEKYLPEEPSLIGSLESSNEKPTEGQSVCVSTKLSLPIDRKLYKIQWYVNKEPVEQTRKFPRYFIENKKDIEPSFEIIDLRESEEGSEIDIALIKLDNNKELCRQSIKLKESQKVEKQIRSLKDLGIVKLKEGETINLKVKFDKYVPEKDIKLYLNDKEFNPIEHGSNVEIKYRPEIQEYSVVIGNAQTGRDEGRYKIQTPNTKSDCQVLIEEKPLKFVNEFENYKLKILPAVIFEHGETETNKQAFESHFSRTAAFECVLSKQFTDVTWFINDILIDGSIKDFERYKINKSEDGKTHNLLIHNCTLDDNEKTIQIRLNKVNKKSSAVLKVDQMPFEYLIKLKRPMDDFRAKEGDVAKFQCDISLSATLEPLNLEIVPEWFRKNEKIIINSNENKYESINESDKNSRTFKLNIKNCIASQDAGEYSCHFYINNNNNKKFSSILQTSSNLIIKENETRIVSELEPSLVINQGEVLELECQLSKPDLDVEWFKDGKVISNKDAIFVTKSYTKSNSQYCYKLRIEKTDSKQTGRYKLQFKSLTTECKVTIKEPKIEIKTPLLDSLTVKENSDAIFMTEYSQNIENELYRIEWFKNGKRLYFSNKSLKYKMELEQSKMSLIVKDCTDEDIGDYEVKIFSGIDDKPLIQKTKLLVQPLEVIILEKLTDVTVTEGETAKLTFKASKSCSCQWYKVKEENKQFIEMLEKNSSLLNDKSKFELINADDRIVFSLKPDNIYGLTMHDVKVTENNYYIAVLKSTIDSSQLITTYAKLQVNQVLIEIKFKCPETVMVNESTKLTINCSLSKIPTENLISRIKAFKNDKLIPLSTEDNKTIYELISIGNKTEPQLQFIIDNIKMEDAGKYSLKLDENKTSCNVKVIEKIPDLKEKFLASIEEIPKIIKDLKTEPTEYLTTKPFSITLIAEGDDLRAEWYHDDKKVIPLMNQVELIKLDTPKQYEFVFNFNNPFISDSGKYQCRISNKHGSLMSASAHIKIKDPKETEKEVDESLFQSKPRFIEYFSDVYMEQATEAQFKCKIIGKPEPKVVWYCNCRKITSNEKFELIKDETDHYTLIIKNVNFNDEGEYTCKANNVKGETSWSANLYLNENLKKKVETAEKNNKNKTEALIAPNFLRKIKDSTVSEGHSAKFDCFIDGEPFPRITWFKNNSAIDLAKNTYKYHLEIDQVNNKVSFTIFNTDKSLDEDEYLIKLENAAGTSQCNAYLVVEPSEDDANKLKRKVRFSLPKDSDVFLIPLHETEIPKPPGEPIISDYKTTNLVLKWKPSPSDLNFYNEEDRDIDSQSNLRYVIEYRTSKSYSWSVFASNINSLSTYVDNLFPGLIYSFRVRAENNSGISDASNAVSTKYLKDTDTEVAQRSSTELIDHVNTRLSKYRRDNITLNEKPAIIGESKDVRYYIEGQTAEVSIQVFGYPSPVIKWMRKNTELISDEINYTIYSDRLSNHHLAILNASEKDEGPYQLIASNDNGTCVHEFYLQQADPPVFLEPFKDTTVENHQDVQMICKVDGIPYPEVKFYKDWHLLAESYRIKIKHIEPDTWIIRINGAIVRDSGLYTCTAKNIAGGTLCSCNLNVAESLLNLPHPDLKTNLITFQRKKFEEDYEIVEQICQSINSKIYRVIERRTAKEYIAKMTSGQKYKDWLKNEADCLNQVNQITESLFVRMHDAYETPNKNLILIFDEIKGKNIIESIVTEKQNLTKQNNLIEEKKVALYIKQLLECLNSLHSRNIVHLDVNPDNIILDQKTKRVKLIGFTHSKSLKPEVYSSSQKEAVFHDYGQPEYISPEIVMNKPVTLNTDMWSLGVLTYVLLAGKSPFFGETMKDTLENIANCRWSFTDDFTNISLDAKDFIQKIFVIQPKERMTAEQALSHPWIRYATQQTSSGHLMDKSNLVQLHSRRVWANQAKQMQPWLKLVKVSELLDEIDTSDPNSSKIASHVDSDEVMSMGGRQLKEIETNIFLNTSPKKKSITSLNESYDEVNIVEENTVKDNEALNPGTYLLPVKDPLFTVRIREYRRTRYDTKSGASTRSPSINEAYNKATPTVKERYHIDVYGKCIQRGSLSRSIEHRSSRTSESPSNNSNYDALTKPFQNFLDYRNDKRNIVGEGLAPIIREKLKDMFLIVGSIVTLRCKIEGNPTPRCFWYHNDRLIIGDDERFKFAQTEDGVITLSIYKARVSDIGVYRCAARNRFGVSITNAKLTVGDTPDRPTRPIVAQYSSDQVYLIWESPSFNGNSDILCYKVDYKMSSDVKWSNALFTTEECCLIKDLQPLTNYRFRVSCINTIGVSSYSWASEEVTTLAHGKSKITIDNDQAEKLLKNQYNLEKRSQQLVLVKKLDEDLKTINYKKTDIDDEFRIQMNHNPTDLYTHENKLYKFGHIAVFYAKDKAHETKRLIKYNTKINDNEIKLLRELSDQDRMVQLIEGFHFIDTESNKTMYALVYAHAVPITDFITSRHKYSEEIVVKILRQLLDAVQWLHLHGFVHLNINPLTILNANLTQVNIKLGGLENAIQLTELVDQNTSACSASAQIGHLQPLEFSAPEVINKEALGMATDIWSIGVFAALL